LSVLNLTHANPRCADLFGYAEEEMLTIEVDQLIPDAARSRHKQHRENYNQHPTNRSMGQNMTLYGLKKDGSVFPLEISLSHYNSQGEMFVIAFIIDVTERLKFQEDLQVMNKELLTLNENLERKVKERTLVLQEALNDLEKSQTELREGLLKEKELHELKSRFVTMASHEFRTSLTTILSSVSLISKYITEEEQVNRDKHIQRIKNSVFSLTEILNDVLSLGMKNTMPEYESKYPEPVFEITSYRLLEYATQRLITNGKSMCMNLFRMPVRAPR